MLGWIRIYGHPCARPAGPARALTGDTKSKKRKENIWIEALKTNLIRTALKFLKKQKNSTPESPKDSHLGRRPGADIRCCGDHGFNLRNSRPSADSFGMTKIKVPALKHGSGIVSSSTIICDGNILDLW